MTYDFICFSELLYECGEDEKTLTTKKINNPDASVGVCCSHKVVAVGFNTLMLRRKRRGIKPSARIKRRLRYHKLGEYKKERVDYIRALKNALCAELSNPYRSAYYKNPPSGLAGLNDFDEAGLKKKYQKIFSRIADEDFYTIIAFAIYWYYLR